MSHKGQEEKTLIKQLANGWEANRDGVAQEFAERLAAKLGAALIIKEEDENLLHFELDVPDICLRDMNHLQCLILGGSQLDDAKAQQLFNKLGRRITFVFAFSETGHCLAQKSRSKDAVFCSPELALRIFESEQPRQLLKETLWEHLPRRRLIPYSFSNPAEGNIFFGREREISRLKHDNQIGLAITGPGRIGKTSLLSRYREDLTRSKDPASSLTFRINFYDCSDHSQNGVAKYFAMNIETTRRSNWMSVDDLVNFLRYKSMRLGGQLNLLFDEVDEVCQGEAFNAIISAARAGYCRLVLCGRGALLKTMLNPNLSAQFRLDMIKLEPLDERSAKMLIVQPLTDLGFKIEEEARLIEQVLKLTGSLPHLLQIYGHRLAEVALEGNTDIILPQYIDVIKWDHVVAQFFITPLLQLDDVETRLVGLTLLAHGNRLFSVPDVQGLLKERGLKLEYPRAYEICNDLVINNVLVWQHGMFRIANEGLYFYAKEMGFLDGELKNTIAEMKAL
jgi:Novel STAND NTPase 1